MIMENYAATYHGSRMAVPALGALALKLGYSPGHASDTPANQAKRTGKIIGNIVTSVWCSCFSRNFPR
jgi:hypothetical protein